MDAHARLEQRIEGLEGSVKDIRVDIFRLVEKGRLEGQHYNENGQLSITDPCAGLEHLCSVVAAHQHETNQVWTELRGGLASCTQAVEALWNTLSKSGVQIVGSMPHSSVTDCGATADGGREGYMDTWMTTCEPPRHAPRPQVRPPYWSEAWHTVVAAPPGSLVQPRLTPDGCTFPASHGVSSLGRRCEDAQARTL